MDFSFKPRDEAAEPGELGSRPAAGARFAIGLHKPGAWRTVGSPGCRGRSDEGGCRGGGRRRRLPSACDFQWRKAEC